MISKLSLRNAGLVAAMCLFTAGAASAASVSLNAMSSAKPTGGPLDSASVGFPTAGDFYHSQTNGDGYILAGGQTEFMWTAGDYVISSVFVLPTTAVNGLTANWTFQDFLGGGNTQTWYVLVNGITVAQAVLPDDNYNGDYGTVSGTVSFADIAPASGGYQVALVLQNTVTFGGGSVAWTDGGKTELIYAPVPEPGTVFLFGAGLIGLAALGRLRKLDS